MNVNLSIRSVAHQTGLSPHVIRAWERRYGAIAPGRSEGGHRVFSEADVQRLSLLRRVTAGGRSISAIATLSDRELLGLLKAATQEHGHSAENSDAGAPFRGAGLSAVQRMDSAAIEESFRRALVTLGHQGLLRKVVAPMAEQVGQLWRDGVLNAAHEHFFTAAVKAFLGDLARQFAPPTSAPVLISCTPANQLHELGAFIASVAAAHLGWRVIYLGPSLPAAEIAGAAMQHGARAVALSVVYPTDDPHLPGELRALRRFLPAETAIVAGGRAASAYGAALDEIGAVQIGSLDDFSQQFDALRRPPFKAK